MRKPVGTLFLASAFAGIVAVTSPLYAEETSPAPSQGSDMMGGGNMMSGNNKNGDGNMMGGSNKMGGGDMMGMMNMMSQMNQMMGMMNMMTQMNQMVETCNKMMQGNMDKDRGSGPATPEKKG